MNRRTWTLCFLALLPACADSCGCGEQAAKKPGGVSAGGAGGASGTSATAAAQGGDTGPDPYKLLRNELKPMPESDLRSDLEAVAKKIDVKKDLGAALDPAAMAKALPDTLDDYAAMGPARTGTTPGQLGEATVASRQYKQGKAILNLKVTDTAHAPQLRADFVPQLTSIGNLPTGEQTGALEDDIPGVRAYHASVNASRAIALIGGRFLVEALVDNTVKPDDAWTAITELDPDELLDAAEAARSKPRGK